MAFVITNVAQLAYANGFRSFQYRSTDTLATIMANGYFDTAAHLFNVHDRIIVEGSDGVWEDFISAVTKTAGSENVDIGVIATRPAVAAASAANTVGMERTRFDGAVFKMLTATTNLAVGDWATITATNTAAALDTDVAATIEAGAALAVCVVAQTAASTNTAWMQIVGSVIGNSATTMTAGVKLVPTSTAGQIDDSAVALGIATPIIHGARQVSAVASNLATYLIRYPEIQYDVGTDL